MRWRLLLAAACALAACTPSAPQQAALPHYVVGQPYRIGAVWRYPRERFEGTETGLATVETRTSGLTADGEAADPQAMAAAHPTLQLPSVVRVTNLDNGYQVVVRVNDRGPADPGRVIALTPRAMALLRAADPHALRVSVEVMPAQSLRLASDVAGPDTPRLALAAAPLGDVTTEALAPPPGAAVSPQLRVPVVKTLAHTTVPDAPPVPLRLPETVTRVAPHPGSVYVDVAGFGHPEYAAMMQRRLASLGAAVVLDDEAPRDGAYRVRIGPLAGAAAADAMLARVIKAGFGDARIVAQ